MEHIEVANSAYKIHQGPRESESLPRIKSVVATK